MLENKTNKGIGGCARTSFAGQRKGASSWVEELGASGDCNGSSDSSLQHTDREEIEWNMCVHYSWLNSNVT